MLREFPTTFAGGTVEPHGIPMFAKVLSEYFNCRAVHDTIPSADFVFGVVECP